MEPSLTALAETLDALVAAGRVVLTETPDSVTVYQLEGPEAHTVVSRLEDCAWTDVSAFDAGGEIPRDMLAESGGGITVRAARPIVTLGVEPVLTQAGFAALLDRELIPSIIWVYGLDSVVDTRTVRFAPWGNTDEFTPLDFFPSPSKVVRILGPGGPGAHIDRWLLRDSEKDVSSSILLPWRLRACGRLSAALAQEIEPDGSLLFRGPPPTRFSAATFDVRKESFSACQAATTWVFENARELDNRHALLAAEIARSSLRDGTLVDLSNILLPALEGARIAYGFGVTQQSKDTLKALSDLRKAVSDDAAKLSETTRSLGAAIAGAVFGNIGLIVARLTLPTNGVFIGPAAILIGVVLLIYVGAIVASGTHYIRIQRDLRKDWRTRLYRFLADDEYKRMVDRPAERAETAFWIAAVVGGVMTTILLVAVCFIAAPPAQHTPSETGTPSAVGQTSASESSAANTLASDTAIKTTPSGGGNLTKVPEHAKGEDSGIQTSLPPKN